MRSSKPDRQAVIPEWAEKANRRASTSSSAFTYAPFASSLKGDQLKLPINQSFIHSLNKIRFSQKLSEIRRRMVKKSPNLCILQKNIRKSWQVRFASAWLLSKTLITTHFRWHSRQSKFNAEAKTRDSRAGSFRHGRRFRQAVGCPASSSSTLDVSGIGER